MVVVECITSHNPRRLNHSYQPGNHYFGKAPPPLSCAIRILRKTGIYKSSIICWHLPTHNILNSLFNSVLCSGADRACAQSDKIRWFIRRSTASELSIYFSSYFAVAVAAARVLHITILIEIEIVSLRRQEPHSWCGFEREEWKSTLAFVAIM